MEGDEAIELKVVMIGNAAVGKTSLINRLIKKTFNEHNSSTVGAMFLTYNMEYKLQKYKLQIWDTAGQEKLRSIAPLYYRDAQGVILVYDVTSKASFEGMKSWMKDVEDRADGFTSTLVVGNKIDMSNNSVEQSDVESFCQANKSRHLTASAKTGQGVEFAFQKIVQIIADEQLNDSIHKTRALTVGLDRKTFYEKSAQKEKKIKSVCC